MSNTTKNESISEEAFSNLMKKSVKELKDKLRRHNIDPSDCFEKEDLVRKIIEHGVFHDESAAGQPEAEPEVGPWLFSEHRVESLAGLPAVIYSNTPAGQPLDLLFVIMHGYGANQNDLVPIAKEIIERASKEIKSKSIAFAFPGGPNTIPGFPSGRAWWHIDIQGMMMRFMNGTKIDEFTRECPPGFKEAASKAAEFVATVRAYWGSTKKFMIGGFSQGAIMSVQVSLDLPQAPDATVLMSGTVLNAEEWKQKLAVRGKELRIVQSHGKADPVLPFFLAQRLRAVLVDSGARLDWTEFDGAHTVPPTIIPKIGKMLDELLSS